MLLFGTITEELNDIYTTNNQLDVESRMPVFRIDDIYLPKSQTKWHSPKYIIQFPWRQVVINQRYLFYYSNQYKKKIRHYIYQYPKQPDFINQYTTFEIIYCTNICHLNGKSIKQEIKNVVNEDTLDDEEYYEALFGFNKNTDLGSEI